MIASRTSSEINWVRRVHRHIAPCLHRSTTSRPSQPRLRMPVDLEVASAAVHGQSAGIVWYRRDLRLTDHEPLHRASQAGHDLLLPVFCIDPRELQPRLHDGHSLLAVPRLGPHRLKFLLECATALQQELRTLQSDLVFAIARPEVLLPALLRQLSPSCSHVALYHHQEPLPESAVLEDDVLRHMEQEAAAVSTTLAVSSFWGSTLYHPDDLPYGAFSGSRQQQPGAFSDRPNRDAGRYRCLPGVMTDFRKKTTAGCQARPCFPRPQALPPAPAAEVVQAAGQSTGSSSVAYTSTSIPCSVQQVYSLASAPHALQGLEELTGRSFQELPAAGAGPTDSRTAFPFTGGEAAGMARLRTYIWGHPQGAAGGAPHQAPALHYFTDTRMQAVGVDNSTKLSPYMAAGCLSPRMVLQELQQLQAAAQQQGCPEAECGWLHMHLIIRDFFIFTALKEGQAMMGPQGIKGLPLEWSNDAATFAMWAQGRTGLPFVDACMRELAGTGYMSNRGRQNVASLVTKELLQDWRMGAALFESLLLDHDAAVNYCNWNYFAGIGNDPRNRQFKTVTQGEQYDAEAALAQAWLPELSELPVALRHRPWDITEEVAAQHSFDRGHSYPDPIVDPSSQVGQGPRKGKGKVDGTASAEAGSKARRRGQR